MKAKKLTRCVQSVLCFVLMITMLSGCTQNTNPQEGTTNSAGGSTYDEIPDTKAEHSTGGSTVYDEKTPLFIAEGDDNLYFYNYKGELLREGENAALYYSENGLSAVFDPHTWLMGYVDKDGIYVIEPEFEEALPFSPNGLAAVCRDGKWGYINEKGEIVIPCQYDGAAAFNENGYAIVYNNDIYGYGVIDSKGNVCLETKYDRVALVDRYILVDDGTGGWPYTDILDYKGNVLETIEENIDDAEMPTVGKSYTVGFDYIDNSVFQYSVTYSKFNSYDDFSYDQTQSKYSNGKWTEYAKATYETELNPFGSVSRRMQYYENMEYDLVMQRHRVSTTKSGYAWKATVNGEQIGEVIYDRYTIKGNYLLLHKYQDENGTDQLTDIFSLNSKTFVATDITCGSYNNDNILGIYDMSMIPDGYFIIYDEVNETYGLDWRYGVVDDTGNVIIEPKYQTIVPYNFELYVNGMDY